MGMIHLLLPLLLAGAAAPAQVTLFRDDFSGFPPGWLSQPVGELNAAIEEYHFLPHRGVPLGPWANAICHLDPWVISDEGGRTYLEQHLVNTLPRLMNPIFLTGDPEWFDYTLAVRVKPLSTQEMAGLVFRYKTNRHYYLFALEAGNRAVLKVRLPMEESFRLARWRELASAPFSYGVQRYYELRVENQGPSIRAFIDGRPVLQAEDGELKGGKVGVTSNIPARFQEFQVLVGPETRGRIEAGIARREAELEKLRAGNPRPRLWKKFSTPRFGAGRNVRFGDLDGDGRLDMLIAQNIPRVQGDAFDHLSCLTAVSLEGKILWQLGRPDPRNGLLTNDTPFQIHDIDGDGAQEVVLIRDFQLQILDGATGRLEKSSWMPAMAPELSVRPYEINNGDSLIFANFNGDPGRRDIVVKDRYRHFWVFDADLKLRWQGTGQVGHYPFPYDLDGDGRDELFIGYSLWDGSGRRLWSHDEVLKDHADGLAAGNFSADPKADPLLYAVGSDEGFLVFDRLGKILQHHRLGHAQRMSIGRFRPDLPGLQIMTINFWKNPGVTTVLDFQGKILEQGEPIHTASALLPVNWRGDGQEFVLLSGNVEKGGMVDGHLRRVVVFPDDGHPDLAAYVTDLTGDPRDEVVLWNQEEVWIYTQDRPLPEGRVYAPQRNPHYNESNYRAVVSLPGWK